MSSYALGVSFSLFVLAIIFLNLRNAGMKEKYATWWVIIAIAVLIASLFPNLLSWVSRHLGVTVPLNLGFFFSGIVLLLITLQYSVDLSRADEKIRRISEEVALLEEEMTELESRLDRPEGPDSPP